MSRDDGLLIVLLLGVLAYGGYLAIDAALHWLRCRQREKLARWQRRAQMDGEPRGFPIAPPDGSKTAVNELKPPAPTAEPSEPRNRL